MQKIVKYPIFLFFIEISDWTSTSNQQIAAIFVQSEQKNQTLSQGTSTSPLPRHLNRNRVKWAKKNCFFWMNWFRHYCCYPFVYHSVIETHHLHFIIYIDKSMLTHWASLNMQLINKSETFPCLVAIWSIFVCIARIQHEAMNVCALDNASSQYDDESE